MDAPDYLGDLPLTGDWMNGLEIRLFGPGGLDR